MRRIIAHGHLDSNGMLTATAWDPQSGQEAKLELAYKKNREEAQT